MTLDHVAIRDRLRKFDFSGIFTQELGWDFPGGSLKIRVGGVGNVEYSLKAVAQKRGVQVFECRSETAAKMPDFKIQRKIETQLRRTAREHLVIYTDEAKTKQVWKPVEYRGHEFYPGHQSGDSLIDKLQSIHIPLDEEEALDLLGTVHKLRDAFDRDKITKKFYDYFQKEHKAFLAFIAGIREQGDREWYASLMLNRLMFVYFIQRKSFLDGDKDYLRNRLRSVQLRKGKGKFHTFYRYFLLALFHQGFSRQPAQRELDADLKSLLGDVPYVNGGLFDVHELERNNAKIDIPDEAFERIFKFFGQYEWTLDTRPLRNDKEINPDVLGYIFEKYINQKQMGAYYTKEDITDYIGRNTIIPCLFDEAKKKCAVAFQPGSALWRLLQESPDRYIYAAVRRGVVDENGEIIPTPAEIEPGIKDVARRGGWNRLAAPELALPTETWREYAARRERCLELRKRLADGGISQINDLITSNLDIRRFAEDAILSSEGPELLRAFYQSIAAVTVLDPTCGSGAFLFAALNILEPLYEACLDRMRTFVATLPSDSPLLPGEGQGVRAERRHSPKKFEDFRAVLDEVARHPSAAYFVLKSIIVDNLYGVDIMEEAVEICKLRLFLKLVSQVENVRQLEPLPDIDFNIRAGNTLVGYTSIEEIRRSQAGKLAFTAAEIGRIEMQAQGIARSFDGFRRMQTGQGSGEFTSENMAAAKQTLRKIQADLGAELDRYLAGDYGIDAGNSKNAKAYEQWRKSHQPFHWIAEFFAIMWRGGFDVVIGNPPYVASHKVRKLYTVGRLDSESCPDIYAWVLERSSRLINGSGRSGMILPLSLAFSGNFDACRRMLYGQYSQNWFSSFGRIPSALFSFDVRVRNTIHIGTRVSEKVSAFSTRLHRWFEQERPFLFEAISYAEFSPSHWNFRIPKLNTASLIHAFESLRTNGGLAQVLGKRRTQWPLHYKKTAYNWLNFCRKLPPCFDVNGRPVPHTKFGEVYLQSEFESDVAFLLLNGKIEFAYWIAVGDDFDVTQWMFSELPVDVRKVPPHTASSVRSHAAQLETAMEQALSYKLNAGKKVGNYNLARCRRVTDQSDAMLAEHIGLSDVWQDIELLYAQVVRTDFDEGEEEQ